MLLRIGTARARRRRFLIRQSARTRRRRAVDVMIAAAPGAHAVLLVAANAGNPRTAGTLVESVAVGAG